MELNCLSDEALAAWGLEHSMEVEYRVELARRIAATFNDADTVLLFDDMDLLQTESDRVQSKGYRGCDRSLLPALWLSTGFSNGGKVVVYAPPNRVEMKSYMELKLKLENQLQRHVPIQILYETEKGELVDILESFNHNPGNYSNICERFIQRSVSEFCGEYHLNVIKKHFDTITKDSKCTFVFPYEMSSLHKQILEPYRNKVVLPDIPTMDKAEHLFVLQSHGFKDIPYVLAVTPAGTIVDDYESYRRAIDCLLPSQLEKTQSNITHFARGIIQAIDRIRNDAHLDAFIKLDSKGGGGWANMVPHLHPLVYDSTKVEKERVTYLMNYINKHVVDERLPSMAIVEEFVEPQKRTGNIDGDYSVAGFLLNGKYFPTSPNLAGSKDGRYIETWSSSKAEDIQDVLDDWRKMFHSCARMATIETSLFSYANGIYSTDLFVTEEGGLKQRDWNIRRGGRSSPETLAMFGIPVYETKVTLFLKEFGSFDFTAIELFRVYTAICEQLVNDIDMYVFSTAYGYCGKDYSNGNNAEDFIMFNVLVNTNRLTDKDGERLPKCHHRDKVNELIRTTTSKVLLREK